MAGGTADGPPFGAVRALVAWAALNWHYLRARLLRDGIDPYGLDLADVLDLAYSYLIDSVNGLVNPHEVRENIDKAMRDSWVDRETWGMDVAVLDSIPPAPPVARHDGGQ